MPGTHALLKVGYDLVCDAAVDVSVFAHVRSPFFGLRSSGASRGRVSGGDGGGKQALRGTGTQRN
jgi:hypothetical protein